MTMLTYLIKVGFDVSFLWSGRRLIVHLKYKDKTYVYMFDEADVYMMEDFDYALNTRLYNMAESIMEQENI